MKYNEELPSFDQLLEQTMKMIDNGNNSSIPTIMMLANGKTKIGNNSADSLGRILTTLTRAAYNDYLRVQQTKPPEAPEPPMLNITAGTVVLNLPALK
jgi:hypothetical protein